MAPPAWVYEVDNFTPSPDKEFICSICQNVFCDPLMTPCGHVFCKHCINSWLTNNRNCPICRKFTTVFTMKEVIPILKNLISNLTLRCLNFKRGCTKILTIESCEAHARSCSFGLVQCSNYPCTKILNRNCLHEHETTSCPHIRFIPCDACKLTMPTRVFEEHNCVMVLKKIIEGANCDGKKSDENVVLTGMIKKDITEWELGNQWPLTCYGPLEYRKSFPGFNDVSFEELRFETLQAKENRTYGFFTRKVTSAVHDVYQKRNRLKESSDDSKCFIKNLMKKESLNVCASSVDDGKKESIRKVISYIPPKYTRNSYGFVLKKDAVTGRKYYTRLNF